MSEPVFPLMPPEVVVDLARSYAGEAVQILVHLMKHASSESVRLSAAKAILNRAYGRPPKSASEAPSRLSDIPASPDKAAAPAESAAPLAAAPEPLAAALEKEEPLPPLPSSIAQHRAWAAQRAAARLPLAAALRSGTAPAPQKMPPVNGTPPAPPRA